MLHVNQRLHIYLTHVNDLDIAMFFGAVMRQDNPYHRPKRTTQESPSSSAQ